MADAEKKMQFQTYLEIGLRRKWFIIIPFVFCIISSFGVYKYLPKVYKATTMILVQPQRIPESYVRSTLTDSISERLNTISQEILSRTRLEKVINEFNLYADITKKFHMEEIVEMMRKKIEVNVPRPNTFSISFEGEEPRLVMLVTNKLASLFIEENLRSRESRAEGTAEFISKELLLSERELTKKESDLRLFKERNMGRLPQQLEANLRILEGLQQQINTTSQNSRAVEDRIVLLQNQIEQLRDRQSQREFPLTSISPQRNLTPREDIRMEGIPEDPSVIQLDTFKRELTGVQSRYTENHPDVVDLKRKIATLEPKVKELLKKRAYERERRLRERQDESIVESNLPAPPSMLDPATEMLITQYKDQLREARLEATRLKEEMINLREKIAQYQSRVEGTPKMEQEMVQLSRDYDLLKTNYQSLLDKKIQSQMAQSLERKQEGEQFRILDLARLPEKPISPDRNKVLLMGGIIGLVAGLGLAWFRESMDQSFHTVSDVESYLEIPVLATIPNLNKEEKKAA